MPGEVIEAEANEDRVEYTIEFEDGTQAEAVMGPKILGSSTRLSEKGAESLAEELIGTEVKGSGEEIKSIEEPMRTSEPKLRGEGE